MVTGAGKGIGKHVARQLAQAGLWVYVGAQWTPKAATSVRRRAPAVRASMYALVVFDVTDPDAIAARCGTRRAVISAISTSSSTTPA